MNITLLSTVKSFRTELDRRQETALYSWSLLPGSQVLIIGVDDEKGRLLAQELGFEVIDGVLTAYDAGYSSKAPLLNDLLARGIAAASHEWVAFINSDIVLLPGFEASLDDMLAKIDLERHPNPFITVRRRDYDETKVRRTIPEIVELANMPSREHPTTGSDIFLARRSLWRVLAADMPPFICGKFSWDLS
jgi:hypothetical protein